jgi:hypothetical protein
LQGLAALLGALQTPVERRRFAILYQQQALDEDAQDALNGLLDAATELWKREESHWMPSKVACAA